MISRSRFNLYNATNRKDFSDKEKEIIRLICEEKCFMGIAKTLFMSNKTVKGYWSRIIKKMEIRTPAGITIYAIKNGILSID